MADALDNTGRRHSTLERAVSCEELHSLNSLNDSILAYAAAEAFSFPENSFEHNLTVPSPGKDQHPYEQTDSYDARVDEKKGTGIREIQGEVEKQEDNPSLSAGKCTLNVQVLSDAATIDSVETDNLSNGNEENRRMMERQEIEGKKERKPRKRGGRRKKVDMLSFHSNEKKEKKGLVYSRKEMEALRFQELETQKKKWIEVHCGLGPLVAKEYDGLVDSEYNNNKHGIVNFDPRLQSQKSAELSKDHLQAADKSIDDLNKLDPVSSLPISDGIDCSTLEGECCEDENSSDEEYSSIQRPAFFVTGEPDFDSGPPQDGLEYLRRVRWETARIPKVVVAKVGRNKKQSPYMPQIPDIVECPENLLPCKEWEDRFLADFQELRLAISQLDLQACNEKTHIQSVVAQEGLYQMFDIATIQNFENTLPIDGSCPSEASSCTSDTSDVKFEEKSSQNSSLSSDLPALSTILKMGSAARSSMLRRRINSIENMSTLSHADCLWLFALCAAVDCPLDADTSSAIRSLLRKCASLRAAKTDLDDEVVILNIFTTISGRYFRQLEK